MINEILNKNVDFVRNQGEEIFDIKFRVLDLAWDL